MGFYLKILEDSAAAALMNRASRKLMPRKRVPRSRILWTERIVFMMSSQPKILKWWELSKKAMSSVPGDFWENWEIILLVSNTYIFYSDIMVIIIILEKK